MEKLIIDSLSRSNYWKDIFRYRELLYFLSWRDILVRYKQATLGIAWAAIRPLLTMLIFTFVFSVVAKIPAGGDVPYPVMVFAALIPWQLFSNTIADSSESILGNSNMITKIYFPRILIPMSSGLVCLVDFLISMVLLVLIMGYYEMLPSKYILFLPVFVGFTILLALGLGFIFSSLNAKYRDFRYVIPFVVQLGLYISPVGFDSKVVPPEWLPLYSLNPMVGLIEGVRWTILGDVVPVNLNAIFISFVTSLVVFLFGVFYFRRTEKHFADFI